MPRVLVGRRVLPSVREKHLDAALGRPIVAATENNTLNRHLRQKLKKRIEDLIWERQASRTPCVEDAQKSEELILVVFGQISGTHVTNLSGKKNDSEETPEER